MLKLKLLIISFCIFIINNIAIADIKTINSPVKVSENRINFVVLHYTNVSKEKLFKIFNAPNAKTSAHYLIDLDGTIHSLVAENKIARHAGISKWKDRNWLNASSIGIEIVNLDGNYNKYPKKQIAAVIELCKDIKNRYNLSSSAFIGHSDIASDRKVDPGKLFPWEELSKHGIGIWYEKIDYNRKEILEIYNNTEGPEMIQIMLDDLAKKLLEKIGYDVNHFRDALRAFRRHFNVQGLTEDMVTKRDIAIMLEIVDL